MRLSRHARNEMSDRNASEVLGEDRVGGEGGGEALDVVLHVGLRDLGQRRGEQGEAVVDRRVQSVHLGLVEQRLAAPPAARAVELDEPIAAGSLGVLRLHERRRAEAARVGTGRPFGGGPRSAHLLRLSSARARRQRLGAVRWRRYSPTVMSAGMSLAKGARARSRIRAVVMAVISYVVHRPRDTPVKRR